ncbi:MAG: inositol monophosphatase [Alphaproteobacteria bacterium]|nr:inositol monophosphatase [Alphaproteobacteria bacterium]
MLADDASDLDLRARALAIVAREAGGLARRYLASRNALSVRLKGPQDWLTEADGAVERLVIDRLGAAFPEDRFLGEEQGGEVVDNLWVIDPIDGTANFARGIAPFAISIAYCRAGQVELGAIYDPLTDELFAARRDGGAYCNDVPIKVRTAPLPAEAMIDAGYSHRHAFADYLAIVERLVTAGFAFRQAGSAALGLAQVAAGRIDGYCELHLFAWDVLAGLLLVREAGGWASAFPLYKPGDGRAVLACTPALAPTLRALTDIG